MLYETFCVGFVLWLNTIYYKTLGPSSLSQSFDLHCMCYCYVLLENLFIFHFRSKQVVIKKILADQAVAAPFFAITFIFGAGLLEGNSLSKIFLSFQIIPS